jgi:hypothetical protein
VGMNASCWGMVKAGPDASMLSLCPRV